VSKCILRKEAETGSPKKGRLSLLIGSQRCPTSIGEKGIIHDENLIKENASESERVEATDQGSHSEVIAMSIKFPAAGRSTRQLEGRKSSGQWNDQSEKTNVRRTIQGNVCAKGGEIYMGIGGGGGVGLGGGGGWGPSFVGSF